MIGECREEVPQRKYLRREAGLEEDSIWWLKLGVLRWFRDILEMVQLLWEWRLVKSPLFGTDAVFKIRYECANDVKIGKDGIYGKITRKRRYKVK